MLVRFLMICSLLLILPALAQAENPTPQLTLTGIKSDREDNVRAYIDISRYPCNEPDWQLEKIIRKAVQDAKDALRALGYYTPEIVASKSRTIQCWSLNLAIKKGKRITFKKISIVMPPEFSSLKSVTTLLDEFPVKEGDGVDHSKYEQSKKALMNLAYRHGYFESAYSRSELRVDIEQQQAQVFLHLDTGPRYRIGKVAVLQEENKDRFVGYFIKLVEGDYYDSQLISSQLQVLNDSGYFSQVEIEADRGIKESKQVPVNIRLTARNQYSYRVGVGVSTDVGVRGSFRLENRRVNRRGHSYILDSVWSTVVAETGFNYAIPLGDSGQYRLDLGAGYRREDIDTSRSTLYKTGVKLTRLMSDGWQRILSIDWSREDYRVLDQTDVTYLLMPGVSWSKTVRNHPLYPTSGWRLYLNLRGASQTLFSDIDMAQLSASAKKVNPLGSLRMISRLGVGATQVSNFDKFPSSLRYFAGGDNSVRGFEYKSLGPVDDNDNVTGGKNQLTGSLELEYPFKKKWGVAGFADIGNAFNDFEDYDLQAALGVGLRYHSPIGPLRIDIARDVEGEKAFRLHISMGPDL